MASRCLICSNPALRDYVDHGLNRGISNSGIASSIESAGGKLDPDVVGRHKARHWVKPKNEGAPEPTGRDLAIILRDKVVQAVDPLDPEALLYLGKDMTGIIGKGLQAQTILDKREAVNKKLGIAAGALSLQMWLAGLSKAEPPAELDDGNTLEGEAVEVE